MHTPVSTGFLCLVLSAALAGQAADARELLRPRDASGTTEKGGADRQDRDGGKDSVKEKDKGAGLPGVPGSLLHGPIKPIDLCTALRLAGVFNPEIMLARQRVEEAMARRQLAAAQILPNLNLGTNYDEHQGVLQQSNGTILHVNRSSLYFGGGANAVGSGTVNIPGLVWNANVSEAIFAALVSTQTVQVREFESVAVRNQVLLRVAGAYLDLLRAECMRALAVRTRDEAREVARITANYAKTGLGRQADANRAMAELEQRNAEVIQAEGEVGVASARLAELLHLDPSVRLHAVDGWVVPAPIVPSPIPLPELLAIAITRRPELAARQAAIRAAMLELHGAKMLPFSPNMIVGLSAGEFGGGSNLVAEGILQANGTVVQKSRFGSFNGRTDVDAVAYWTLRNLGVGNLALVRLAQSNLRSDQLREVATLDLVRGQVAQAYARTFARFAQIDTGESALLAAEKAFQEDLRRTRNREGLPIEVLDSLRLSGRGRQAYLDAIIEYNRAQFDLYVALGQPPANCLARPVPSGLVPVPAECANAPSLLPVPSSTPAPTPTPKPTPAK